MSLPDENRCIFRNCGHFLNIQDVVRHIRKCHLDIDLYPLEPQDVSELDSIWERSDSTEELKVLESEIQKNQVDMDQTFEQQEYSTIDSNDKQTSQAVFKKPSRRRPRPSATKKSKPEAIKMEFETPGINDGTPDGYYSKEFIVKGAQKYAREHTTALKAYKCQVTGCPKEYKNRNGIAYHGKHSHKGPVKLNCHKCGFGCASVQGLSSHLKSHNKKEKTESDVKTTKRAKKMVLRPMNKMEPEYLLEDGISGLTITPNAVKLNNKNPARKRKSPLTNGAGDMMYAFAPFPTTYIKMEIKKEQ